jgi:hypothetical protein
MAEMRAFTGYILIGVPAALAMGLVSVAGVGLAVGARPMPERGAAIQHIDRTHKGNRLDLPTTLGSRGPVPTQQIALPDGCEPAFSPLVSVDSSNITGHCVS